MDAEDAEAVIGYLMSEDLRFVIEERDGHDHFQTLPLCLRFSLSLRLQCPTLHLGPVNLTPK